MITHDNFVPTHLHRKRGSTYQVTGIALVQTDSGLRDMDAVVLYRGEDGRLWVRGVEEFIDGRFEPIDPVPPLTPDAEGGI
ncbi:DUF1653 domain-containing protein [Phyllobacterium leguminum]|uniref:DUF1653 domain-containing protein n=1 Tax=Phyllobacterium leguminum TaxID=314237 RepID=A0A318T2L7_9HYPH|nr:DUF1653 domain-containing protein [Phyllobacterium leguminum]PYE86890.1 hypothetical protein C7477_11828 [Phyllobacterium leguminum]